MLKENAVFTEMRLNPISSYSAGEGRAYFAWDHSVAMHLNELEMNDTLFDGEIHDFISTLRRAGIDNFVFTCPTTSVFKILHSFEAEGCKLGELCAVTRKGRWDTSTVKGIRIKI